MLQIGEVNESKMEGDGSYNFYYASELELRRNGGDGV